MQKYKIWFCTKKDSNCIKSKCNCTKSIGNVRKPLSNVQKPYANVQSKIPLLSLNQKRRILSHFQFFQFQTYLPYPIHQPYSYSIPSYTDVNEFQN